MTEYTIGPRCTTLPRFTDYRTLYPIYENGTELIAFVGMKNGWGKGWQLFTLRLAPEGASLNIEGVQPQDPHYTVNKEDSIRTLALMREVSPQKFKTRAQLLAAKEEARVQDIRLSRAHLQTLEAAEYEQKAQYAVLSRVGLSWLSPEDMDVFKGLLAKVRNELDIKRVMIERQLAYVKQKEQVA